MRTYAVLHSLCSSLLCSSLPPLSVLLPCVQFNIGAERSSRVFLWACAISGGTKKGLHELMEVPKAHHQVAMASIPPPEVVRGCPKGTTAVAEALQQEEMVRPPVPEASLECLRCESINTNFCYYNNYSLSQPRYFCKGCRRHWTKGGSLRTVPVGGGCRNNKSSSSRGARGQQAFDTDSTPPLCNALLPSLLAIASLQKQQSAHQAFLLGNPTPEPGWSAGFPDILTTAFLDGTGDPSGFLYSINRGGYGDADSNEEEQQLLLPFRGGLGGATTTTCCSV